MFHNMLRYASIALLLCGISLPAFSSDAPTQLATIYAVAKPIREVEIISPAAGMIRDVLVEEGQTVSAQQPLLQFDNRLAAARVDMSRAEFARSASAVNATKLEAELAAARFKNIAAAFRQSAATEVELEESHIRWKQAGSRYQSAMSEVQQWQESLNVARVEEEMRTIRAPFDGKVVRVLAVPGKSPTVQDVLVHLVDTSKLRIELYVPANEFHRIRDRKTIKLAAQSPVDKQLEARVAVIDDIVEPATQTIRCVLEIDNKNGKLPAGFRVQF